MEINKQETVEEIALELYQYQSKNPPYAKITPKDKVEGFIAGVKYQAEKMYTEEEVYNLLYELLPDKQELDEWFKDKRK